MWKLFSYQPPHPSFPPTRLSSAGRFTDLPSNMTVKEGQNIEMACAFQSRTASVYLEIQWWFVKAPEPTDGEENAEEVHRSPAPPPPPSCFALSSIKRCASYVLITPHPLIKGIRASNVYPRYYAQAPYVISVVLVQQPRGQCQTLMLELFIYIFSYKEQRVRTLRYLQLLPGSVPKPV